MYNINNTHDLNEAILLLENEVDEQKRKLNDQLNVLYESFKPVNVVKDVFSEVVTSDDFRSNLISATMGISTGYITKKLLFRKSSNLFKSLAGNLVQYGLANLIIHPSKTLKTIFLPLLGRSLTIGKSLIHLNTIDNSSACQSSLSTLKFKG
jgi:hypothetical protein